jgi:hypothetical protein
MTHVLVQHHPEKKSERVTLSSSSAAGSWAMRRVGTRVILPHVGPGALARCPARLGTLDASQRGRRNTVCGSWPGGAHGLSSDGHGRDVRL